MRSEFIGVWSETWREIWLPLIDREGVPEDIFCELYRALAAALKNTPSVEALADVIDNPVQSREAFEKTGANDFAGERALVAFLEAAHSALDELAGDELSNRYFILLAGFIEKFSLRYDLRRPCTLCPTLPGVFASLVRDLRVLASQDAHLDALMKDFENAVRDLRHDCSDGRIKTCIQKQVHLLEAIGRTAPGVTGTTLGAICNQVGTWPHDKLKEAMRDLYGFASDYPGIRHGGTPANALRAVDMRDMVALSVLLAGFTPYLAAQLNADSVYRGASDGERNEDRGCGAIGRSRGSLRTFRLIALGPIEQEATAPGRHEHDQRRDLVAAMEKALADLLVSSGLRVMNRVVSRKQLDEARFAQARAAFAKAFPPLATATPVIDQRGMADGR